MSEPVSQRRPTKTARTRVDRTEKTRRDTAPAIPDTGIEHRIYVVRGERVLLDADLAQLYGVATKQLNQAVRRNAARFPIDFMFQLTRQEAEILRSQIVTSRSARWGGRRYLPFAFTEQGVAMLSGVLASERAVAANILIMRAFVALRRIHHDHLELRKRIEELARAVGRHDALLAQILEVLDELESPGSSATRPIGFRPS